MLKYSFTKELLFEKYDRNVGIIFSKIQNIKKVRQFFKELLTLINVFQKVKKKKQYCAFFTFEYLNMSQINYLKMGNKFTESRLIHILL